MCIRDRIEFTNEGGSASDDCTIDSIEYVDVMSGECPIVVTRTFTVFDPCGNSASCEQTITIDDTTNPTITCPTDIDVEGCDTDGITNANLTALAYSETEQTITEAAYLAENGSAVNDECGIQSITYIDSNLSLIHISEPTRPY